MGMRWDVASVEGKVAFDSFALRIRFLQRLHRGDRVRDRSVAAVGFEEDVILPLCRPRW